MQKDLIIQKLKEQGLRITKQRLILLDIILEEDCPECRKENACTIELEDNTVIELNEEKWNQIIRTGLAACGYAADGQKVRSITARSRTRECVEA